MNKYIFILGIVLIQCSVFTQELVYEFELDETIYESPLFYCVIPDVLAFSSMLGSTPQYQITYWNRAYKVKNSNQIDIFSFNGVVGSIKVDTSLGEEIIISQTILDNDDGWEYIQNSSFNTFKIFDDNNEVILADAGSAYYGFDGQNTYVFSGKSIPDKIWKFRSDMSSNAPSTKKRSGSPAPMMMLMPSGDLKINLTPTSDGKTSIQLFNMLGRVVFNKEINTRSSMSFTIKSNNLPNSPFITKIDNTSGTFFKKEIPVR